MGSLLSATLAGLPIPEVLVTPLVAMLGLQACVAMLGFYMAAGDVQCSRNAHAMLKLAHQALPPGPSSHLFLFYF